MQLATLLLIFSLVFLSLYAHYRASRAIEDEQFLRDTRGKLLMRIDNVVGTMDDPDTFLDGYKGTLWSMRVGGVDLTDPLAAVEMTSASKTFYWPMIASILIPVAVTLLLGRVFCSWICPAGLLFELTDRLRGLLRFLEIRPGRVVFSKWNKYIVLVVGSVAAAAFSLPIFSLIYPPAMISRMAHAIVFGASIVGGMTILGMIVAFEVLVSPRWWCRTVCPGGALYGLLGWKRILRVKLNAPACTGCRDCEPVCPMGLYPVKESATIECDNCGICLRHCPTEALYFTLSVSARPKRRPRTGLAALIVATTMLIMPSSASAHHILGLPHYSYKENYPQAPTLEYPATSGPYDILMTSYPGKPIPGEAANVTFYIKDRNTDTVYQHPVSVCVLKTATFGGNETILPETVVEPFDRTHKVTVLFPTDGEYVVELTMRVEGQDEVIPFLVVSGEPTARGAVLVIVGAATALFVIVVRAIRIKRARAQAEVQPCAA